MTYDYRSTVLIDACEYIKSEFINRLDEFDNYDEFREAVSDACWISDMVTGNASGSYTCNTWEAEENLCHNWDLLREALADFGGEFDIEKGAEYYDVTIRCWMLGQILDDAIAEAGITEDDPRFRDNDDRVYTEEDAE